MSVGSNAGIPHMTFSPENSTCFYTALSTGSVDTSGDGQADRGKVINGDNAILKRQKEVDTLRFLPVCFPLNPVWVLLVVPLDLLDEVFHG